MSWKVHDTDDVFAALRGLCSNSYRMYDPCEYRYYYDHDCETYECVVEEAAREYQRLLDHCDHQREQLKAWGNVSTLRKIMEDGMDNIDGGTEIERIEGSSKVRAGSSITDELREWAVNHRAELNMGQLYPAMIEQIADRIDERYSVKVERLEKYRAAVDAMLKEYVKLPVDADGVPIEIGDYLHCDETGKDFPCRGYCCSVGKDGERCWTVECSYDPYCGTSEYVSARRCHHVKPDSWERIIGDALTIGWPTDNWNETASAEIHERLVERCRRLAGGAE